MKIAIIGGHLSPALAVMDALSQNDEVVFFGRMFAFEGDTAPSLEYRLMQERQIPFVSVKTARLQRKLTKHTIPSLAKFPVGFFQSMRALKKVSPDVVLSFGGYLSLPVCFAAKALGIPVVIHEQTLQAGVANKLVSKIADVVCISWDSSRKYFPADKTVLTGNPIREFQTSDIKFPISSDTKLPLLYVTGGSAGSHALNVLVEASLDRLLEKVRIIHQTGDAGEYDDFARLQKIRESLPQNLQERYVAQKFIDPRDTGSLFGQASLLIGRSGINTVTELLFFGTPSLLIPLPYGQKQEQLHNAQFLEKLGMAEVLLQEKASPQEFCSMIFLMLSSLETYQGKAKTGKELVHPDAAKNIIKQLSYVVKKKSPEKK